MKQKLIALLMVLSLCLSLLAGCGTKTDPTDAPTDAPKQTDAKQDDQATEAPTTEAAPAEPDKLTIWIAENLKIENWETNAQTIWLEEQGNFELEFIPLSSADYSTKVGVALTVGAIEDLPDIIIGTFSTTQLWEYAQAETIIPLTDYYNDPEMSANIRWQIEENLGVDYTKMMYLPDGNIYSVANYLQSYSNEYPHKIWIYKPWLDALGEDVPTTTEEFYQLLKKVKETDLNGNGKADEIPMLGDTKNYKGYFEALMNSFSYVAGLQDTLVSEDGVVSAAFTTEGYKEGLAYIEKLFNEDLIISEALTMDTTQAKTLLTGEEQLVFCLTYYTADASVNKDDYVCILPMEAPNGNRYASYGESTPSSRFVITANCKNPEAAFRLGDLLSSEKSGIMSRYGQEGVNWAFVEDTDTSKFVSYMEGWEPSIALLDNDANWSAEVQNNCWRQVCGCVLSNGLINGRMVDAASVTASTNALAVASTLYQTAENIHPIDIPVLVFTEEEQEKIADVQTSIDKYASEFRAGVFAGNIDLDAEWDNYLAELDKMGLDEWLAVYQAAYDRMYK